MRIVFFGTPDYVLPVISLLNKRVKAPSGTRSSIVAVVTQKAKPVGRKKILTYSAVDNWAHKRNIAVFHESKEIVNLAEKPDLGILASYGEIIPKEVINFFSHGILNIHPSLLPLYRGASPVQAAIAAGEKETGVTIIKLDQKLDHGKIISQFKEEIKDDDTTKSLRERLFSEAAEVLVDLIKPYTEGKIKLKTQEEEKATVTTLLKKRDGFLNPAFINGALKGKGFATEWTIPFIKTNEGGAFKLIPSPISLERFIRAMNPWPLAWTEIKLERNKEKIAKRIKIIKAHLGERLPRKLILDEVQLEGKNVVSWRQFKEGYPTATFV